MHHTPSRLTILVDDLSGSNGLAGEHGFSCLIERGSQRILFDTGQTGLVLANAKLLGADLNSVESIVLSHGHYDHTGGLRELFEMGIGANLYAHPEAFCPKYVRDKNGSFRFIGMPVTLNDVRSHCGIVWTRHPIEIAEGIFVTGPIPRTTNFEDTGGRFFVDDAGRQPDLLPDDQAVFWESREGIVVVLGCAHAGVINTLNYICEWTGKKSVYAVLGGMHLLTADTARQAATNESLRNLNIRILGPMHCTGQETMSYFQNRLPDCYRSFRSGSTCLFE
jgi:7,8-dihydropterin-6-yl-methyl-4-(beta-D-ribofuranosyl)aminobenzene 5'-phosphate synthase